MDEQLNVTLRRKNKKMYDSFIELNDLNDTICSNTSDIRTRSLPDLSTSISNEELEHKITIDNLRTELISANSEIDNLLEENNSLKNKIMEQKTQIDLLKQMCTHSVQRKSYSISSNIHSKVTTISQDLSTPKSYILKHNETDSNITKNNHKNLYPKRLENVFKLNKDVNTNTKETQYSLSYKQIHILGTQQCKGLSSALIKTRKNTMYEKYKISSFIKPNANCNAVLSTDYIFTHNDKLILCIGENDTNPTKILLDLCSFLNKHINTSIFIISILHNPHLNENKLNDQLKLICNNYNNCEFVQLKHTFSKYRVGSNFILDIARQINIIIDTID